MFDLCVGFGLLQWTRFRVDFHALGRIIQVARVQDNSASSAYGGCIPEQELSPLLAMDSGWLVRQCRLCVEFPTAAQESSYLITIVTNEHAIELAIRGIHYN